MPDLVTPYVLQDLFLPREFDDEFADQLVSRATGARQPFARKIDLWWMAVMIGVAIGRRTPMPTADKLIKFNTAAILSRDPWRIANLELIALAEEDDMVISDPSKVLTIGNEYAATGLAWLAEELRGSNHPILDLMTKLHQVLPSAPTDRKPSS